MSEYLFINLVFSFILFLIGLMFIEGIWNKKGKIIKSSLKVDNFFFPKLKDKRILKAGDQLASLICFLMAFFTLINGLLSLGSSSIPNVSAIFIFIAVILTWPVRVIFIFLYKNKKYEEIFRIWPFQK